MAENARIDDLRRRVQKDPASIAFAQLAEEYRRAGQFAESVEVCRAGLAIHPTYLSARVTLGRALIELGQLADARTELGTVLKSAPENLAAIRGVAEICHKQGSLEDALRYFKAALAIARHDPELEQTVNDLSRQVAPQPRPAADNSLSLEDMRHELKAIVAAPPAAPAPAPVETPAPVQSTAALEMAPVEPVTIEPATSAPVTIEPRAPVAPAASFDRPAAAALPAPIEPPTIEPPASFAQPAPFAIQMPPPAPSPAVADPFASEALMIASPEPAVAMPSPPPVDPALARAHETIAVLEQWLDAIHGSRAY
jgi:tetratricopeptide repeat protein